MNNFSDSVDETVFRKVGIIMCYSAILQYFDWVHRLPISLQVKSIYISSHFL